MSEKPPAHSPRYIEALQWAAELHGRQRRKGKEVPYISHLIAVSALVWEDGGDEEQAIAALLHDAIEDAGVSAEQIAERFGERVAQIVEDCTDTNGPVTAGGEKEPWLVRKRRYVEHLLHVPLDSLLVSAADKAHNARDQMLDARRDPSSWSRFNAGIDGTAWYQLRIHHTLKRRLPDSRSTELLGEALQELLDSQAYRQVVPQGIAPSVWAAGYAKRQEPGP
ncbi:HD domain-containing protein [Cyanobium sp. CH-040]|uniref:HD domain-containing protein n=1 Tax=Cyanobium sp. CH-040 TaxID=2823708 RepID=UPI0020CBDA07|nr:HD domain-containing protein [Cyanobium sp. CH-040]MCP9928843.1 HD domain-containing protein [Cyanobium sp. CH-040]